MNKQDVRMYINRLKEYINMKEIDIEIRATALKMLDDIILKIQQDVGYYQHVVNWIPSHSTVLLRDEILFIDFGDISQEGLLNFNAFTAIDSAHLHVRLEG